MHITPHMRASTCYVINTLKHNIIRAIYSLLKPCKWYLNPPNARQASRLFAPYVGFIRLISCSRVQIPDADD